MKALFGIILIFLLANSELFAQDLQVYKSDGEVIAIPIPEIDSITFTPAETTGPGPCPGTPTVTDIDGNVYNTVFIAGQCWMKENLKTTRLRTGDPLLYLPDFDQWVATSSAAYVWYAGDTSYKDKYGALYNTKSNLLCPDGWHMPSSGEWSYLINNANGRALKSCRQVDSPLGDECNTTEHPRWEATSAYGLDTYGFSALPGGYRRWDTNFGGLGVTGAWWTTAQTNYYSTWIQYIYNSAGTAIDYIWGGPNGFSVRCVKD